MSTPGPKRVSPDTPTAFDPTATPAPMGFPSELAARYELIRELGRGGMGMVFCARDLETGETVAIKLLKPEIAQDENLLERFRNELRLARKITHKNVCRTYELLRFGSVVAISMEYVEGDTLREVLRRFSGVPIRKGIEMAREICAALGEAHSQGIVHRDLKPENILVDINGSIKVMDFGIARSVEAGATLSGAGAIIGTPAYMSPEQAESKPADARSDIYSLGLILYEMFTGQAAFTGETPVSVALKQIREAPKPPRQFDPFVPPHIERAILKCLEKDPKKRFQSVDELLTALTSADAVAVTVTAPVDTDAPISLDVPLRLSTWTRQDWFLVAAAFFAIFVFAFVFGRLYPFSAMRPGMTRDQAIQKARNIFTRGLPGTEKLDLRAEFAAWRLESFSRDVLTDGLSETQAKNATEGYAWGVGAYTGEIRQSTAYVRFNRRGEIDWLRGDDAPDIHVPVEQVRAEAETWAHDLLGLDLHNVPPVPFEYDPASKSFVLFETRPDGARHVLRRSPEPNGTPLEWKLPSPDPNKERLLRLVVSPGKLHTILYRDLWVRFPASGAPRVSTVGSGTLALIDLAVAGMLLMFCLFLFFKKGMQRRNMRDVWFLAAVFTVALIVSVVTSKEMSKELQYVFPVLIIIPLVLGYCVLAVPFDYLRRTHPDRLAALAELLRRPWRASAAGMALLRGAALGTIAAALLTLLLWPLAYARLAAPSTDLFNFIFLIWAQNADLSFVWPLFFIVFSAVPVLWLFVVFPSVMAARASSNRYAPIIVTAFMWLVFAMFPLLGTNTTPVWASCFFAALQGALLAFALMRYDVLTATATAVTLQLWFLGYGFHSLLGHSSWIYSMGLVLIALTVLLGLALATSSQIADFWSRTKAVLE